MSNKNEALTTMNGAAIINTALNEGGVYCSMPFETEAEKKLIFNATSNCDMSLKECVNKPIEMVHLYIEPVTMSAEDEGGEQYDKIMPRMIIIDKNGKSYGCVSQGAFNAMKRIIGLYGEPTTWTKPLTIIPVLKSVAKGQTINITIA